ncbi:hypothetical protein HJC23_008955 [Cyclotella cryptica]|uniref:Uncharacterized protein n=1 Tax=Cyclotella cryptica TaxID=29204 RepID=A0ABD3Q1B7_9STRA
MKSHGTRIRDWGSQMKKHAEMMDQVGTVRQLLQSVEARQQEVDQTKKDILHMQQQINKTTTQWKHLTTTASQSKENNMLQQTLQKQTTKLKQDVVQAHAYWKKQWAELNKRMHKYKSNRVDELYATQVTIATLQAEHSNIKVTCETAVKEAIHRQMEKLTQNSRQCLSVRLTNTPQNSKSTWNGRQSLP